MPTVAELSIEVDVKDTGAQQDILRLQQMLQRLATEDPDVSVHVDAAAAKAEFEDLSRRILGIEADTVTIETEADAKVALAQLDELRIAMRNLDRSTVNVDVDIDTQGALAHIAVLDAALKDIRDVDIDIDKDGRGVRNLNQISAAAQRASGTIRGMTTAIIALGPALIPLAGGALTAILGITAGLVAAGAGATLFGFVAVSALTPVFKALEDINKAEEKLSTAMTSDDKKKALEALQEVYAGLTPAQSKMVNSLIMLRDEWRAFVAEFEPDVFDITGKSIDALSALLPAVVPLMKNITAAIKQLQDESLAAFKNPVWQEFFQNITNNAAPALISLGHSFGNLITGIAALLNAFFPFQNTMLGGFEALTLAFRDWAIGLETNQGFQNFANYVIASGPAVVSFLQVFGQALIDLIKAAAPVGLVILDFLTSVFKGFSKLVEINPLIGSAILVFAGLTAVFVNMIGPILAVANVINLLIPLFSLISGGVTAAWTAVSAAIAPFIGLIAAIAAIVAILVLAYQHLEGFRAGVQGLWQTLIDAGNAVMNTVAPALSAVVEFFVTEWNNFMMWWNENSSTFSAAWDNILMAADFALTTLVMIVQESLNFILQIWNAIWPGLSDILAGVWEVIKGIISGAFGIIRGIFQIFASLIAGDWGGIWDGFVEILFGVWDILAGIVEGGLMIIWGLIQVIGGLLAATFGYVWDAIVAGAQNFWGVLTEMFSELGSAIKAVWDFLWGGIVDQAKNAFDLIVTAAQWLYDVLVGHSIIPDLVNAIVDWFNTLGAFLSAFMQPIVDVIVAAWNTLLEIITSVVQFIVETVQTGMDLMSTLISAALTVINAFWTATWTAIQAFLQAAWDAMKVIVDAAINIIRNVIVAVMAILSGDWSTAWTAIKEIANIIWEAIKSLIRIAIDLVKSLIDAGLQFIQTAWKAGWDTVLTALKDAATKILGAVEDLLSDIGSAITGFASRMYNYGRDLIIGLADGIRNAASSAVGAAEDVISSIAGLLPGSPADYGPLSGHGYVKLRGQRFIEDLETGLADTGPLRATMKDVADILSLNVNPTAAFDAIAYGAGASAGASSVSGSGNIYIEAGAVVVQVGDGVDPEEARKAFEDSTDSLADALLTAVQRR